jgi:hypothetical protein
MNYDTTGYRPAKFPITQSRRDIVEANKSPIETMIEEHIREFMDGIGSERAYMLYKSVCERDGYRGVYATMRFLAELKRGNDTRKGTTRADRSHKLVLNEAGVARFKTAIDQLNSDLEEESKMIVGE